MIRRSVFAAALVGTLVSMPAAGVAELEPGQDEAAAEVVEPEASLPAGHVARSAFTRRVVDREPSDAIDRLANDEVEVSYFTEIRDMAGHTVTHRWEWGGQVMAEVPFEVAGPRWRVHSTKRLDPSWLGEWTVSVVDSEGHTLARSSFTYTAADTAEAPVAEPAPAAPADLSVE